MQDVRFQKSALSSFLVVHKIHRRLAILVHPHPYPVCRKPIRELVMFISVRTYLESLVMLPRTIAQKVNPGRPPSQKGLASSRNPEQYEDECKLDECPIPFHRRQRAANHKTYRVYPSDTVRSVRGESSSIPYSRCGPTNDLPSAAGTATTCRD